jgi:2,4-dienoyl-CoA reductase (NADPH2)
MDLFIKGEHERCQVNAAYSKEREMAIIPAEKKKRVMVIGSGPAGMEAARVATMRGHEVTLCEHGTKLGGLITLAAMIKGFEVGNLSDLIGYLQTQVSKVGVDVQLGKRADFALIAKVNPDVVIVATGCKLTVPKIPGINKKNVLTSLELHRKVKTPMRFLGPSILNRLTKFWLPIGKKVIIVGGLMHGCEVAEFLVKRGRRVVITEPSNQLGTGLPDMNRVRLLDWLEKKGTTMLTEIKYEEITDKGLILITKDGKRKLIEGNTVLITTPPESDHDLYKVLEGRVPEVYMIGDCKEPKLIVDAIEDGRRIACSI